MSRPPPRVDGFVAAHAEERFIQADAGNRIVQRISVETAIVERYRRRESSIEEALIEMYMAGISVRRVEDVIEARWAPVSARERCRT
ncbi:hypothetical protein ACVWZV_004484 [Bradyrhizobium sp. GM5.1]